ncbi:ribonuclease HII [Helicobacter sp. MIT 99-5507]|uniref:ribonuclease HII n=1 Tax=Helicobacter sp. MIT 99-5507 TaxID=152489 RepID=UPI000E1F2BA4|nr:ribonuclease HII [Helicobacter sp. MIT 99-5507]RDU58505.1 ribonuclease HII [Helicobacter sp. MIT 99-5507]
MDLFICKDEVICGIDEAGRGSVAGSLFVCGVKCSINDISDIRDIDDSKKLSREKRDRIFNLVKKKNLAYFVMKFSANDIDNHGISKCMNEGLSTIMYNLDSKRYLFDGNTNFGVSKIECIIKGDSKIPQISLASIIAKSLKDKESDELHLAYPLYEINKHKGYATKKHIELINLYGLSQIHRKSFKIKKYYR